MSEKTHIYNLIILDESGSMETIKPSIIRGFNELVETIKSIPGQFPDQVHKVCLVSFHSQTIKKILWDEPVETVRNLNEREYSPGGGTPLLDAMGSSFDALSEKLKTSTESKVLVTILTDGEENSSREYNLATIRQKVEQLETQGWTFTYIGANQDVLSVAAELSIKNALSFHSNDADVRHMFEVEKKARMNFSEKIANNTWKTDESYYEEKKN